MFNDVPDPGRESAAAEPGDRRALEALLRSLFVPVRRVLRQLGHLLALSATILLILSLDVPALLLAATGLLTAALWLYRQSLRSTELVALEWSPLAIAGTLFANGASELFGELAWQERRVLQSFFRGGEEISSEQLLSSVAARSGQEVVDALLDLDQRDQLAEQGVLNLPEQQTPFGLLALRLVDRGPEADLRIRAVLQPLPG